MSAKKPNKEPIPIDPPTAYEMQQKNPQAYLIDIRTTMEFLMIGHPEDAIHIPWMDEPDWTPNPRFVPQVREVLLGGLLGEDETNPPSIILICRSGRRSHEAGTVLLEAGLPNIYHIDSGFEGPLDDDHHRSSISGWRFHSLPWSQC